MASRSARRTDAAGRVRNSSNGKPRGRDVFTEQTHRFRRSCEFRVSRSAAFALATAPTQSAYHSHVAAQTAAPHVRRIIAPQVFSLPFPSTFNCRLLTYSV